MIDEGFYVYDSGSGMLITTVRAPDFQVDAGTDGKGTSNVLIQQETYRNCQWRCGRRR